MKAILIIEDDVSIAELQRDYLELNNFAVHIEHIGSAGLEKARREQYDLIILDLMLPGIDGFEICRILRRETEIPILMVSARKEDIDKIRGLGLGADDYITKPFSPSELVARVKSHLARFDRLTGQNEISRAVPLQVGNLRIDTASRRIFVGDDEVALTAKEFGILFLLAKNPNRVFTKEEIFDRVWGEDRYGEIATVTVHIRKIREKIERDPANPRYIETVWGVGYRLSL